MNFLGKILIMISLHYFRILSMINKFNWYIQARRHQLTSLK